MAINACIWHLLSGDRLSILRSVEFIIRHVTEQAVTEDIRTYFDRKARARTAAFVVLLGLWLLSAVTLSKSFTGILLESFFNVKEVPIVTTLQDIRKNKRLGIGGHLVYLNVLTRNYKCDIKDIIGRLNKDPDNNPNGIFSPKIAQKVIKHKTVMIVNSMTGQHFLELNYLQANKMVFTGFKQYRDYLSFIIPKKVSAAKVLDY